jgi:uncharacterized protein (DUF1330 family)
MNLTTLDGGKSSAMRTVRYKQKQSKALESQVAEFLARGGKIKVSETGPASISTTACAVSR